MGFRRGFRRGALRAMSPHRTDGNGGNGGGLGYEPAMSQIREMEQAGLTEQEAGELRAAAALAARRVLKREREAMEEREVDAAVAVCMRDFEKRLAGWMVELPEVERNREGGDVTRAMAQYGVDASDAEAREESERSWEGESGEESYLYYRKKYPLSLSQGVGSPARNVQEPPQSNPDETVANLEVALRSRLSDCGREALYEVEFTVEFEPEFVSATPSPQQLQLHWNVSNCSPSAEHFKQIQCASTRRRKVVSFIDLEEEGDAGPGTVASDDEDSCPVHYDSNTNISRWADIAENDSTLCDDYGCETGLIPSGASGDFAEPSASSEANAGASSGLPRVYTASIAVSPDAEMHAINFMLHSKDVDEKKGHWLLAADPKPGTTRIAGGGACDSCRVFDTRSFQYIG